MGKQRRRGIRRHQEADTTGPQDALVPRGRRTRVRNRLLGSVALCALAVLAAGAPSVVTGTAHVAESQELVDQAETSRRAVSLAHALADERDAAVRAVAERGAETVPDAPGTGAPGDGVPPESGAPGTGALGTGTPPGTGVPGAGTPGAGAQGVAHITPESGARHAAATGPATVPAAGHADTPDSGDQARVDRKAAELRPELPAAVRQLLDRLPELRQQAEAAEGSAKEAQSVYSGYTDVVQALGSLSESLARELPARSAETSGPALPEPAGEQAPEPEDAETAARVGAAGTADALPYLGRAVEHASAARGLLLGVLAAGDGDSRLVAAAQLARAREQAALADFDRIAPDTARDAYTTTVNGTEVTTAESYLDRLTGQPGLTDEELTASQEEAEAALTARIDRMRGVQLSLAGAELARLEQLRDDDVTALQLRIALLGGAVLLAAAAGVSVARSLARPLAAVRRGTERVAADPIAERPVRFTGRNDEFADVVRAVNALHTTAVRLGERARRAEAEAAEHAEHAERKAARERLAAECERLRAERDGLREQLDSQQDATPHHTFVRLALRGVSLVERQLALIESMEEKESEPERLATLFTLDHLATRMRRHGENLLLLAGCEHTGGHQPQPVPLLDVLRAAISEIERYERVRLTSLPPHAQLSGHAADDVSHLVAELLENATAFSPPDAEVELSGWLLENGEVMLTVQDEGIGVAADRLAALNERLGEPGDLRPPDADGAPDELGLGLYVVARLAARHGIRVQLRAHRRGGVAAVAVLPRALLPDRPAPGALAAPGDVPGGSVPHLPGSVAEANSNTLPTRPHRAVRPGRDAADLPPTGAPDTGPQTGAGAGTGEPAEHARAEAGTSPGNGNAQIRPAPDDTAPDTAPQPAPDATAPVPEARAEQRAEAATAPASGGGPAAPAPQGARRYTDKGLPKRTPHLTDLAPQQAARRPASRGAANAEELRERLGGFQRGAREGLRAAAQALTDAANEDRAGADELAGTEEARP
ncbi:nitrate- and nitrite sensing domain-containing protein [Streptomyces sp. JJ66]|uniref:sensor histidine kinase n=1 Tax=Streptomyces sp. JJ66 TaxID=2803843 RepID=UPI001C58033B|nr:nitrate- and nitrite sensing domain-containing protein [Streptomyces sp. JJ66]MBW1603059.1 nitrate- and nitrite sensing domain-containing protein [Streptomyces sp. JJ66]